jgi:hypothetical protein
MSRIVSNKLAILSPYLALVGIFGVVSLAAAQLAGEAQRAAEIATKPLFADPYQVVAIITLVGAALVVLVALLLAEGKGTRKRKRIDKR